MIKKKTLKKASKGELALIKAFYEKPTANMALPSERWKAFALRQRPLLWSPLVNIVLEVLPTLLGNKNNNKRHLDWKGRRKTILFTDGMILCI